MRQPISEQKIRISFWASEDGVFRIVSCAHIVPVKRLDLLLKESRGSPACARKFEWVHFGDGTGGKSLNKKMTRDFPQNARGRLMGNVPNSEIIQHYRELPVDVFVNVSGTEGGAPVAIQEAISCGIPIIATLVGGNPEVVSEKNGILLDPGPSPHEIAVALLKIWTDLAGWDETAADSGRPVIMPRLTSARLRND
jgi:glycosyltransferase involved in cell wall biosynthesis